MPTSVTIDETQLAQLTELLTEIKAAIEALTAALQQAPAVQRAKVK